MSNHMNGSGISGTPRSKSGITSPGFKRKARTMTSSSPMKRAKTIVSIKKTDNHTSKVQGSTNQGSKPLSTVNIYTIPKPEVMSDRQILRRLNNNIK